MAAGFPKADNQEEKKNKEERNHGFLLIIKDTHNSAKFYWSPKLSLLELGSVCILMVSRVQRMWGLLWVIMETVHHNIQYQDYYHLYF